MLSRLGWTAITLIPFCCACRRSGAARGGTLDCSSSSSAVPHCVLQQSLVRDVPLARPGDSRVAHYLQLVRGHVGKLTAHFDDRSIKSRPLSGELIRDGLFMRHLPRIDKRNAAVFETASI